MGKHLKQKVIVMPEIKARMGLVLSMELVQKVTQPTVGLIIIIIKDIYYSAFTSKAIQRRRAIKLFTPKM